MRVSYVSVPGHILSSAQYACARGPRGDVRGEGRLGGLGGAGTKADASSKRRGIRRSCTQHGPRRVGAGRGRAGRSKLKRMSNPRTMSRASVCPVHTRSTPNNEPIRCSAYTPVKSKTSRYDRARPVPFLPFYAYFIFVRTGGPTPSLRFVCMRSPVAALVRGCPQQIRGFPAGTPSAHAAAHTVLTATPPMSRSCERRPARCAMLTRIPRQRSLSERITQLLGTVPYLSAEASPLHERQHMRRRRSRIRALPPHPDVSSRDRVFHSADGARAQSKSNFADFVQSVQLCGFRAWGYLTPRSAAPEEPNG